MRDLSQHVMDIIQNSIAAKARKVTATICTYQNDENLVITITDNGVGMDSETVKTVVDPFTTSRKTRKVGLGIPLFKSSAERSGGFLEIKSSKQKGTTVKTQFINKNIDRPPLGAIGSVIAVLISSYPDLEFEIVLKSSKGEFLFNSFLIAGKLDGVPINSIEVLEWIEEYIDSGVKSIFGGVLNEIIS